MKHLKLMTLFVAATMMFWGCEKFDSSMPDRSSGDQEITDLECGKDGKVIATFTGTCSPLIPPSPDDIPGTITPLPNGKLLSTGEVGEWYDEATDWRVTGRTIWHGYRLIDEQGNQEFWGWTELLVDGDRGKWEMFTHGNLIPNPEGLTATVYAVGMGVEGEVKGLKAEWIYTINYKVADPSTFLYYTEGKIIKTGMNPAFKTTCIPIDNGDPDVNEWYEVANDWRVAGKSIWTSELFNPVDEMTNELGGTAEIFVEGDRGKWEMNWTGVQTMNGSGFTIVADVVGKGVEGEVKGMRFKSTYNMDFDGTPETLIYYADGFIFKANKKGKNYDAKQRRRFHRR